MWSQAESEGSNVSSGSVDDLISLSFAEESPEGSIATLGDTLSKLVSKNEGGSSPNSDSSGSLIEEEDGSPSVVLYADSSNKGVSASGGVGHVESESPVGPVSDSEKLHSESSSGSPGSDSDASESVLLLLLSLAVPPGEDSSLSWSVVVRSQAFAEGLDVHALSGDDLVSGWLHSEWSEGGVLADLASLPGLVGQGVGLQSVVPDGPGSSVVGED